MTRGLALLPALALLLGSLESQDPKAADPLVAKLAGTWVADLSHNGETSRILLHLEAAADGGLRAKFSTPAIHVWEFPVGPATVHDDDVRIAALGLTLVYDRAAGTLTGTIPAALVPVYAMAATFRRSRGVERRVRPEPSARVAMPVWTFDAGAPIWADAAVVDGVVIVGADDGRLHAIDARTGRPIWEFRAGGAIRARPTFDRGDVFVQADDGFLYRVSTKTGEQRWRVRVCEKPIERVGDEKSRYENLASAATVSGGRLYLGTHDGHVLALDPEKGSRIWDFAAGDSVVSTPSAVPGRIYFGSFDGRVYAVDAASGALLWKHDTQAPVTTGPAISDGRVIVGSRSYDLFAFDGATGRIVWNQYYWFSWVESPARIFDGTVYIGSSDAAKLFAFDARSGRRLWEVDAGGSAWAQPAVTASRVFIGTVGTVNYLVPHHAAILAVDRKTGRPVWRHPVAPPATGTTEFLPYGFAGSPALTEGLVVFGGLDGRVYAFAQ